MVLSCPERAPQINIAGIRLRLADDSFLKALSFTETDMLRSFLSYPAAAKKGSFRVDIKVMSGDPGDKRLSRRDISNLKKLFPFSGRKNFTDVFTAFCIKNPHFPSVIGQIDPCDMIMGEKALFFLKSGPLRCRGFMDGRKSARIAEKLTPSLSALKLLFYLILGKTKDGIIIHASSVEDGAKGYLFCGPSNSGKSTTAGMLRPERVLSDDTSVIRKVKGQYLIFPNPWWNRQEKLMIRDPKKPALLRAIFFIQRSGRTAIRKMPYKEALATLLYRDWPFQQKKSLWTPGALRSFYDFSLGLADKIPFFELEVKKGALFARDFRDQVSRYIP